MFNNQNGVRFFIYVKSNFFLDIKDHVKYMLLIEISQTKGSSIDGSILSIDLIGSKLFEIKQIWSRAIGIGYGRTSAHRINIKYGTRPNIFELTMLDVGLLYEYEIHLENNQNDSAYFISNIYIYRGQYYE